MSTTDLPGSSLLAGRYRLVERLGAGGMSVVWRGFDEVLGRQVAVKVLPPSTSTDPAFRRRLRAEAQAAARLTHPNITNVYDYGEATTADGEPVPYVVMELIDGESLAAVLARVRRLSWQQAVRISAEVAAALAAAHSRGIVHRDVTPANVMLTPTGAKVVDFGISALIGENDIDPDGSLLGTPAYLAPERLEGGQVSPATDVYAVGLLIYRTLIGQLPWDVGTTTALLRAHQYTEPEPLPPVEGLPPAVSALVGRCLEKRPDDRPSSAELAHVLAGISAGAPVVVRGYTPDWSESGEDTTILPAVHSYAMPGSPVAAAAAAEPALRKSFDGKGDAPDSASKHGESDKAGRGNTRKVLVTAGLVAAVGLGVLGTLELTGNPTKASGSNALPQPSVVPASEKCIVSYAVWSDSGKDFKAMIALANNDDSAIKNWNLSFLMPGDQVVSGDGKINLQQQQHLVTVSSPTTVKSESTVSLPITGRYAASNLPPLNFVLNGVTCDTYVSSKPGEPTRQVQHLSNGKVQLGPTPSASGTPLPGISIDPTGGIHITPTTPPAGVTTTTPVAPGGGGTTTTPADPGGGGITTTPPVDSPPPPSVPPSVDPSTDTTTDPPSDPATTDSAPNTDPGGGIMTCDPTIPGDC